MAVFPSCFDRWLGSVASNGTRDQYRSDIGRLGFDRFNRLLGGSRQEAFVILNQWKADMVSAGLSASYISRSLSTVRSLLGYLYEAGVLEWPPPRVKGLKASPVRDPRGPSMEVLGRIAHRVDEETDHYRKARNGVLFKLLAECGLRRNEIATLRVEDIVRSVTPWGVMVRGKGKTGRDMIPLSPDGEIALRQWIRLRGQGIGPLLGLTHSGIRHVVGQWGAAMGLSLHPHSFRHTAITEVAKKNGVEAARIFGRHSSIATTQRYLDCASQDAERSRAAQSLSAAIAEAVARNKPAEILPIRLAAAS